MQIGPTPVMQSTVCRRARDDNDSNPTAILQQHDSKSTTTATGQCRSLLNARDVSSDHDGNNNNNFNKNK